MDNPDATAHTEYENCRQSAVRIAEMAGFSVPAGTRALVAHADGVGPEYPISMEKLSPTLGFYVVKDWKEGCAKCIEILKFGGLGHTLSIHTRDEEVVRQFGLYKPAFRICVNTPAALGAVGYTTNLFPSMTLGCGAAGGNITSDNISPLHLINLKRVAYGVRDVPAPPPGLSEPGRASETRNSFIAASSPRRATIEQVVDQWLGGRSGAAIAPPLSSFKELEPPQPRVERVEKKKPSLRVSFVKRTCGLRYRGMPKSPLEKRPSLRHPRATSVRRTTSLYCTDS